MIGTEADFITKAGFAEEVSVNWITNNIYRKDGPAVFGADTKEIVWFMVFQNAAFPFNVDFEAKWIEPAGSTYASQTFTQVPGNGNHAITALAIRGTKAAELLGKWKIEVYYKGNIIAYRSFQLH